MTMRDKFHESAQLTLVGFIDSIAALDDVDYIKEGLSEAAAVFLKGRTSLRDIVIDDLMHGFTEIMSNLPPEATIPYEFYEMLGSMKEPPLAPEDARQKLDGDLEKINSLSALRQNGKRVIRVIPDFISILRAILEPTQTADIGNTWTVIQETIAHLVMDEAALQAKANVTVLKKNFVHLLNDYLSQRLKQSSPLALTNGKPSKSAPETSFEALIDDFGDDDSQKNEHVSYVGRAHELQHLIAALIKDGGGYALTTGSDGVGKSALSHSLAQAIAAGAVPDALKDAKIYNISLRKAAINMDGFLESINDLFAHAGERNGEGGPQIILKFEDMHTLEIPMHIFALFETIATLAMDSYPNLRLIVETNEQDRNALFGKMPKFMGRFMETKLPQLGKDPVMHILRAFAADMKERKGLDISEELLEDTYKMTGRHLPSVVQPKASLDILAEAVAYSAAAHAGPVLDLDAVAHAVSARTGIGKDILKTAQSDRLARLKTGLPQRVVGQEEATTALIKAQGRANAGLNDPNKPLGSFFFLGPTGVGKTESAKVLAELLGLQFVPIDMGNYGEKHDKSGLIGAPKGYVGYNESPALAKITGPCVLLLDEFEKAHPDIQNILLAGMEEGRIQMTNGQVIDLRNSYVIITSNIGAESKPQRTIGFSSKTEDPIVLAKQAFIDAAKKVLKPEFLNRLGRICVFNSLPTEAIATIAVQKVEKISAYLRDKNQNLRLELSEVAMAQLLKEGYDPAYGARPMERAAERHIKDNLSDWLLENKDGITRPTTVYVKHLLPEFAFTLQTEEDEPKPAFPPRQVQQPPSLKAA